MNVKATGYIETRGYTATAAATDAMNKAAAVEFVRQEHIGSGFVTTMVEGSVDAVDAAVEAGKEAAQRAGTMLHAAVIARLHPHARNVCIDWKLPGEPVPSWAALGLIEARGYVPMIVAADAAVKTSDVYLTNYFNVGSGYSIIAMRGELAGVQAAVDSGNRAAGNVGEVVTHHVIPQPHRGLETLFPLGGTGEEPSLPPGDAFAMGFMETRGIVTLIAAADAALKASYVRLLSYRKIGSGLLSVVLQGEVSAVKQALQAGQRIGEEVGTFITAITMPSPHHAVINSNTPR